MRDTNPAVDEIVLLFSLTFCCFLLFLCMSSFSAFIIISVNYFQLSMLS